MGMDNIGGFGRVEGQGPIKNQQPGGVKNPRPMPTDRVAPPEKLNLNKQKGKSNDSLNIAIVLDGFARFIGACLGAFLEMFK